MYRPNTSMSTHHNTRQMCTFDAYVLFCTVLFPIMIHLPSLLWGWTSHTGLTFLVVLSLLHLSSFLNLDITVLFEKPSDNLVQLFKALTRIQRKRLCMCTVTSCALSYYITVRKKSNAAEYMLILDSVMLTLRI